MSSTPNFTIDEESKPGRVDVECNACKTSVNVSATNFGVIMAQEFIKQHKCPKVRKP